MTTSIASAQLTIRAAEPADRPTIHDLHVQAFGGRKDEGKLVDLLIDAGHAAPSLVAIHLGQIVGHVVFSPMTIDPPREGFKVAGMGPVAVLPAQHGRGIGSHLIRAGIDACRQLGYDAIAVLGAPGYYVRFGFLPAMQYGLANEYVQDEHFMILSLRDGALQTIPGLLRYAPAFHSLGK